MMTDRLTAQFGELRVVRGTSHGCLMLRSTAYRGEAKSPAHPDSGDHLRKTR